MLIHMMLLQYLQSLMLNMDQTLTSQYAQNNPDSKVHEAYMGPSWGWQDPGGPHVGPVNFAIRELALMGELWGI